MITDPDPAKANPDVFVGFPSLAALKAAHLRLTKAQPTTTPPPDFLTEVRIFLERALPTGRVIENDTDRCSAQGLLDYWVTVLYRAGVQPPPAILDDFDPEAAHDRQFEDKECPYLGLSAFGENNAQFFFGRQGVIAEWIEHLRQYRALLVLGPNGSGKFSLVRAGVVPALQSGAIAGSDQWSCLTMNPGPNPLEALARLIKPASGGSDEWIARQIAAFRKDPRHLGSLLDGSAAPSLLIVNRLEEIFTRAEEADRRAFLANLVRLTDTGGRHSVILILRSDFSALLTQHLESDAFRKCRRYPCSGLRARYRRSPARSFARVPSPRPRLFARPQPRWQPAVHRRDLPRREARRGADVQRRLEVSSTRTDAVDKGFRGRIAAQIWDIAPDTQQPAEQEAYAQMLAARRLGENGVMIPIEPSAVFAAWQSFQARNFGPLHLDPPRLEHRREAIACEASEEWFAAVWHLDQMLRADPGNADLLARRGVAHLKLEDWGKAIDDLRLATAQQPAYAARLGQALFSNGDFAGAEVEFKKALALNETDPVVREQLSKTHLELGQLEAAERELVMLTGPASDNPSPWQRLAVVRLELGYKNGGGPAQLESYRQTCRDMIKQFEERDEAGAIVAWPCMLAPDCGVDPARLVAIAQGAVQKDPTNFYRLNTLGAAHCRAGQWEEAVKVLTHSRRAFQEHQLAIGLPATAEDGRAPDWVFLAMAQHALEKSGKAPAGAAQRALEKAEKAIDKLGKSTTGSPLEISRKSWNKVELHRLLSEVRQLFEQPAPPAAAR